MSYFKLNFIHYKKQIVLLLSCVFFFVTGCTPQPPVITEKYTPIQTKEVHTTTIPPVVQQLPYIPPPKPTPRLETYSVVVDRVPVKELLFALARDAEINVDIHPDIEGTVSINAIDQTLPQLLERITKQVDLRYLWDGELLIIAPDTPYIHLYKVGYVNIQRETESEVNISTQSITSTDTVGKDQTRQNTTTQGQNNSTTKIKNTSTNHFWEMLEANIRAILDEPKTTKTVKNNDVTNDPKTGLVVDKSIITTVKEEKGENVIINPNTGVVSVRATERQHRTIQHFLDQTLSQARKQVLIEATIAEVRLNDSYQAGIDWESISSKFSVKQRVTQGTNLAQEASQIFQYNNVSSALGNLTVSLSLLEKFGKVRVLSSPKIMALNNQSALLKVVDNKVYFVIETKIENQRVTDDGSVFITYRTETTPKVLPVGLIMSVTPQISEDDMVILNVRPTISRIIRFVPDPSPALAEVGASNLIPEIQVREIESILQVKNGNTAVIGGLMQDSVSREKTGLPLLSDLPTIGDLFSHRDHQYEKTELVIFLRPRIITSQNMETYTQPYRVLLPNGQTIDRQLDTGFKNYPIPQ